MSRLRTALASLVGLLISLPVALLLAEGLVRVVRPTPRVQVVRSGNGVELVKVRGVPSWRSNEPFPGFWGKDCLTQRPEALVVGIFGDSVPYSTGPVAAPPFSVLLQERLGEGWCVVNASEPAFHGVQQLAAFEEHLGTHRLDLAVWGQWKADGVFLEVDDAAMEVSQLLRGEDGLPLPPAPVGAEAHAWLFQRSELWRYGTFAVAPTRRMVRMDPVVHEMQAAYAAFIDQVAAGPTEGLVLLFPSLDAPLPEVLARPRVEPALAREYAAQRGVPWIDVGELLLDQDVEAVRADRCCHYNPHGHVVIAERLEPWFQAWGERRRQGVRTAPEPVLQGAPPLPCDHAGAVADPSSPGRCTWPCGPEREHHPSGRFAACTLEATVRGPGLELAAGTTVRWAPWERVDTLVMTEPGQFGGRALRPGSWRVDVEGVVHAPVGRHGSRR